jgi:hypothetical protein
MGTPLAIDRFLDRVANELTPDEQQKFMPGIRGSIDQMWELGDTDAYAQEYCDKMLAIAKAGDPFPELFAEAARVLDLLDRVGRQEGKEI